MQAHEVRYEIDATPAHLVAPAIADTSDQGRETSRRRVFAVIAPLVALQLALWLGLFVGAGLFRDGPNGKSMGTDFAVFLAAAQTLKDGGNPYDYHVLYRTERAMMQRQHLPVTTVEYNVRAGNPPIMYWALEPLTQLPFRAVALIWILSLYGISGIGFLLSLRYLGWNRWLVPTLVFLLMPQVVLGACYGNIHGLLFATIACSLVLTRRYPFAAGVVIGSAWLKPQLALPVVLLVALFHIRARPRFVAGFAAATTGLLIVTGLTVGWHVFELWMAGVMDWSHHTGLEPNLSAFIGLYAQWAPTPMRLALAGLSLLVASVATGGLWWKFRHTGELPLAATAWLWFVWFLAAPFAHYPDEIVLTLPILASLGQNGWRITQRLPGLSVYLFLFSLILFPDYGLPANFLSVALLASVSCLTISLFPIRSKGQWLPLWNQLPQQTPR